MQERSKSWVPSKVISGSQLIHSFGQSSRDCSTLPPNWRDELSWPSGWVFIVSALMCMVTHWTGPMMNRDINYWVVMIHYATILCELSTSRGYWVYTKINRRIWLMGVTTRWSLISYEFSHYGWRLMIIDILNRGTLISYEVKISCPLKWS